MAKLPISWTKSKRLSPNSGGDSLRVLRRRRLLHWRAQALERCAELERDWVEDFPKHNFLSGRLKRGWPLQEFDSERFHREIEEGAAKRKRDPKIERLRRLAVPMGGLRTNRLHAPTRLRLRLNPK